MKKQFWKVENGKAVLASDALGQAGLVCARTGVEAVVIAKTCAAECIDPEQIDAGDGKKVLALSVPSESILNEWFEGYADQKEMAAYRLEKAMALTEEADKKGFAQISDGVYLSTWKCLHEEKRFWNEDDPAASINFAEHQYWVSFAKSEKLYPFENATDLAEDGSIGLW